MTNTQKKTPSKRGRPPKHGGYSIITSDQLPENRKHVRRYLSDVRNGLICDLGGSEGELTTAQQIMIDRVVCKLGVLRCLEEYVRENQVMLKGDLVPALKERYLAYSNSVRLDLVALGLERRAVAAPTLAEVIEEVKSERKQD